MTRTSLQDHLSRWAGADPLRQGIESAITSLAEAGIAISELVAAGALAGELAAVRGHHQDGDSQKELDAIADRMVAEALANAPVALLGSEEAEEALVLDPAGTLAVAVDPLDGSSNIDTNVTVGTIFSILPYNGPHALLQKGTAQLAAGFLVYGPQTALVLTVGEGTHIFVLDRDTGTLLLAKERVVVPAETAEYAINGSNARHWEAPIRHYVGDCLEGAEGPRGKDFNTRWIASMVAEAFRILIRGGVYLYPGDARKGYTHGRLRLIYEANPVAFLMTQADGAATDGTQPILDIVPSSLHQRVPLVFGSKAEVERVTRYHHDPLHRSERSPLFGRRGLLRA